MTAPANRLRRARELAGLSLGQAAKLLGWAQGPLYAMEIGEGVPPTDVDLAKLAELYHVPVAYLHGAEPKIPEALRRQLDDLEISSGDRDTVLEFAGVLSLHPPQPSASERLAAVAARRVSAPPPTAATRVVNVRRDATEVKRATAAGLYVYIGRDRSGRSKWGNPFTWKPGTLAEFVVPKDEVLSRYEAWLRAQPHLMAALGELRGKILGCWCKPGPCHGDILARLADEMTPAGGGDQ